MFAIICCRGRPRGLRVPFNSTGIGTTVQLLHPSAAAEYPAAVPPLYRYFPVRSTHLHLPLPRVRLTLSCYSPRRPTVKMMLLTLNRRTSVLFKGRGLRLMPAIWEESAPLRTAGKCVAGQRSAATFQASTPFHTYA